MKEFLLSVVFFMLMPTAFADIAITADQNVYNLGDRIKASASILRNEDFEGFFKLSILCGSYNLQYFLTPVTLEANFRTAANVPELAATASMLGNCAISGQLLTNSNQIVEEKTSSSFEVTNKLTVLPVNSKITAVPGDSILVAGIVNEAFGANVLKASAKIALDNYSHAIEAVDGKFNLVVDLPKNIRSGKHKIEITASDPKLNLGENSIELDITAIPSYIKLDISDRQLLPGSKIEIITSLYDQADDLINSSLNLELKSPSGNNVFIKVAQSSEKIGYEFSQYAEPGIYVLSSAYKNLPAEGKINITPVREVRIKYENETVFVENTGNVLFEDELTFLIESELKKYPITKKIRVEPSKTLAVDLSREVPLGTYSIKVPIKEGLEPVS
ncbi:hypothetical protein HYY71_02895, partial [Candidatus Woesearchaeota archaeon]|nr:hypothetical protein [Candidatus Woesearchaeota archaeon]